MCYTILTSFKWYYHESEPHSLFATSHHGRGIKGLALENPMSLDMYYFEKNKELVTKMASGMEDAIKEAGFDFTSCSDEFLKEIADGASNSLARSLFEYLKVRRNLQSN